ncbi:NAD(P)-dependent oxidoreductase [Martelella sp. HB161492]|uniref:NAD(P)-dependent oxidoreductase n=1 Tax=Martelella sp. HB161492 TaxID=2720726 RepID=UPI0015922555|nr:NAD(P)-dependent oxidoreductase [Martelella sp. HB161492]
MQEIGFIGFGEAARAIVDGWQDEGRHARISAFDLKVADADKAEAMRAACAERGVTCAATVADMLDRRDLIFSLVTADNALEAARSVATAIGPGAFYLDGNSCSPDTKRKAAAVIVAAGGRYADVAIMSPIHPGRHQTPCLVSGPDAADAAAAMTAWGMKLRPAGAAIGDASAVKMVRSVMIKGTEALMAECFLTAFRAGVLDQVLASLGASDPGIDWPRKAAYCLERMMVHGTRRAAEMGEAVATLHEYDVPAGMSAACVLWQKQIGALHLDPGADDLATRLQALSGALNATPGDTV